MMKKFVPILLFLVLLLCSCDLGSYVAPKLTQTHIISDYGVSIPTPDGWNPIEGTNYDLYLGAKDETVFFGVFCYRHSDLAEEETMADFFTEQNDYCLEGSNGVSDIRKTQSETLSDRTVYSRICEGNSEDGEFVYYLGMADLEDTIVWFVGSTNSAKIEYLDTTFDNILKEITLIGTADTDNTAEGKTTDYFIENYGVTLSVPENWIQETDTQFDLDLSNPDGTLYVGVFAYLTSDLNEMEMSAEELFTYQNEEVLSAASNRQTVHEAKTEELENKTIYSTAYTADYNGARVYYYLSLVELEKSDRAVWVCITGMPSVAENNENTLRAIVESVR